MDLLNPKICGAERLSEIFAVASSSVLSIVRHFSSSCLSLSHQELDWSKMILFLLLLLVGVEVTLVASQQVSYQMNCLSNERYIEAPPAKNHYGTNLISNNARMKYPTDTNPYRYGWTLCLGTYYDDPQSGVSDGFSFVL
jgi:hypothetical protein